MATGTSPEYLQLDRFVSHPIEDIDVEYKEWLDLTAEKDKATLAKAAIALANHGGGHIILGFKEVGDALESVARPSDIGEITQDAVNAAIRRYAEPEYHCQAHSVPNVATGTTHTIVAVPGSSVPVMCKRDQREAGVSQHRVYVRKPGPRSEEPHTAEEWRALLDRCVRARREEMLDSMRSIFLGRVESQVAMSEPLDTLEDYCSAAHQRWREVVSIVPSGSPSRFPYGHYEMGFAFVGVTPATDLRELNERLNAARRIKLSGWTPFLHMSVPGWEPYAHEDFVEAWVGRPAKGQVWNDAFHADFWRASLNGGLYTIRGYAYDGPEAQGSGYLPGKVFDVEMPIRKIGEGILFARRYAEEFTGAEEIAIRCKFTGLSGRALIADPHFPVLDQYVCRTPEVMSTAQLTLQQVQDNLPEVVHDLLRPLFEKFGFYRLHLNQVQNTLNRMRRYI